MYSILSIPSKIYLKRGGLQVTNNNVWRLDKKCRESVPKDTMRVVELTSKRCRILWNFASLRNIYIYSIYVINILILNIVIDGKRRLALTSLVYNRYIKYEIYTKTLMIIGQPYTYFNLFTPIIMTVLTWL